MVTLIDARKWPDLIICRNKRGLKRACRNIREFLQPKRMNKNWVKFCFWNVHTGACFGRVFPSQWHYFERLWGLAGGRVKVTPSLSCLSLCCEVCCEEEASVTHSCCHELSHSDRLKPSGPMSLQFCFSVQSGPVVRVINTKLWSTTHLVTKCSPDKNTSWRAISSHF